MEHFILILAGWDGKPELRWKKCKIGYGLKNVHSFLRGLS